MTDAPDNPAAFPVRLTEAELWFLINAIPQAGTEGDDAGNSAQLKLDAAFAKARKAKP